MHAFEEQKLTDVKGIHPDQDDSFKEGKPSTLLS